MSDRSTEPRPRVGLEQLSRAAVGVTLLATTAPLVAAPPAAAATPDPAEAAAASPQWLTRLSHPLPEQVPTVVTCSFASQLAIRWPIPPGPHRGLDFAKLSSQASCSEEMKAIGVDQGAAKNGVDIPSLSESKTNEYAVGVAVEAVYGCGVCAGSWVYKLSSIYIKDGNQAFDGLSPNCTYVTGDGGGILGASCLALGALAV